MTISKVGAVFVEIRKHVSERRWGERHTSMLRRHRE
jgi:hypothetical protein